MEYEKEMKMLTADFYIFGCCAGIIAAFVLERVFKEPIPWIVALLFSITALVLGWHSFAQRRQLLTIINLDLRPRQ